MNSSLSYRGKEAIDISQQQESERRIVFTLGVKWKREIINHTCRLL